MMAYTTPSQNWSADQHPVESTADWFILENDEKTTFNINMPIEVKCCESNFMIQFFFYWFCDLIMKKSQG